MKFISHKILVIEKNVKYVILIYEIVGVSMKYILFNPLSSHGKSRKYLKKLGKILTKRNEEYEVVDVILTPFSQFQKELTENDSLVVFGGDGTIHVLVNQIIEYNLKCRVFAYRAGTGNDFFRDYKEEIIEITELIKTFPVIKYDNNKEKFINGVGSGIDAAVCSSHDSGGSYLKDAYRLFRNFKKFSVELTMDDDKVVKFDDTWFVCVQHGCYFGGGMKLSPNSKRDDKILEIVLVRKVKLPLLLMIFPLIFFGWHMAFKKVGIEVFKVSKVKVKTAYPLLQRDGEVYKGASEFEVFFEE